jgi:hypothetical protein
MSTRTSKYGVHIKIIQENIVLQTVNPLTPNNFQRCRAVSPLKSRTTYKDIANSVSKFGGILFSPIRLSAVAFAMLQEP